MAETLQPTGIVIPNADGKEAISKVGVAELRATGVTANAAIRAAALTQGTMPLNADLDSWVDDSWNGLWHTPAATAATVTGLPSGTEGQAFQLLQLGSRARVTTQIYIPYGFYTTGLMTRSVDNVTTRTWTEWAPLGGASLDPMTQHAIRQAQMIHAIGPVDTGGLGAVAFRFDHGFTNFRDKVLPAVKARGIKVAQAYNPRNWHYAENSGVTATDLNGWVAAGDVEIMNHSADHLPAETRTALHTEIVTGLAEIEAELPAARGKVWGFAPPGVSTGNWMGFNDGRTPEGWDTYAGQLILRHHAVGTGYLAGTSRRVLDGQLRDGLGHVTIDARAVADIKADIDAAVTSRMGLQLMMHPSQLDTAGKLTTAQFLEVLDYAVAKRDAGELTILSPYQMLVADATNSAVTVDSVPGLQTALDAKLDIAGKVITTEDLNTLTETGTYYQLSTANATTARNYPVTTAGRVGVTTSDTGWVFQEFTTYSQGWPKTWRRNLNGAIWGAWRLLIDELELTARLADAAPKDTGDRNITRLVPGVSAGHWTVRRIGKWVYMNLYDLTLTATAGDYWQVTGFLPVGLRPPAASQYVHFPAAQRTVSEFTPGPFRVDRYGGVTVYGVTGKQVAITASWVTNDAFPTTPIGDPA